MSARPPSHHANETANLFKNPWPSAQPPSWTEIASGGFPLGWAHPHLPSHRHARAVKVVTPDWGKGDAVKEFVVGGKVRGSEIVGTWLGHASAFVEVPWTGGATVKVLCDPIFSARAGPSQYTGAGRFTKTPCQVEDLPGCDVVLISHNHYDHLDLGSILALHERFPHLRYFVPLGIKSWFTATGIPEDQVHEKDWWEHIGLYSDDFARESDASKVTAGATSKLRMTCVPAQHNSGRGALDQSTTLWCGWVLEHLETCEAREGEVTRRVTRKGAVFFAGDTGYRRYAHSKEVCPAFEEIGAKFGPFDLSFVPIWRGGTLGWISWAGLRLSHESVPSSFHGTPADAVSIHLDVKSKNTVGIHFGTFVGSEAESLEAVIELREACEEADVHDLDDAQEVPAGRCGVLDQGQSLRVVVEELAIF